MFISSARLREVLGVEDELDEEEEEEEEEGRVEPAEDVLRDRETAEVGNEGVGVEGGVGMTGDCKRRACCF